jgi:hypothetical protein
MSSRDVPALTLDVSRRRTDLRCASSLLALCALASVIAGVRSPVLGLCLAVVGLGSVSYGFWRACWWGTRRLDRIAWLPDGRWLLSERGGQSLEGRLRGDSRVGASYLWLRWDADIVRSMLLFHGDLTEPELRRLIVRCRIQGLQSLAYSSPSASRNS